MTVRWGILGAARIAEREVMPAIAATPGHEIVAVASRDAERATALADHFGVGRVHATYDAVVDDPGLDAVYVPLPNNLHAPWALRALRAGKAVLVEKPATLDLAEADELIDTAASHDALLVEAFMYRFHPQWAFVTEEVARRLEADGPALLRGQMGFAMDRLESGADFRLRPELGGGALLDVGCYPIDAASLLFGEATEARLAVWQEPEARVDFIASGLLGFGGRRFAAFEADFTFDLTASPLEIRFADGVLVVDRPFFAWRGPARVRWLRGDAELETRVFDGTNPYEAMVGAFGLALPDGAQSSFARREARRLRTSAANRQLLERAALPLGETSPERA